MTKLKKKNVALIVGGTGQFGISLSKYLLRKNFKIIITTRNNKKHRFDFKKKILIKKLSIFQKKKIELLVTKEKPNYVFYFAGQSNPSKSFRKKKETYLSNFVGCKNFLEILKKNKFKGKFINATSCEMYGQLRGHIKLNSPKRPVSPYGVSKVKSFNLTKSYRNNDKLNTYNAIIFNSESLLRPTNYLIPKICLAAINAKKNGKKTKFGNLNISREWNWCDEQSKYLIQFINKKPQDFILSNGKSFTARQMIKFAFDYFKLDYSNYILSDKLFFRKKDINNRLSDFKSCLKRNNIRRVNKVYGKYLITKFLKYYLKVNKFK